MEILSSMLKSRQPLVVGSVGTEKALESLYSANDCDVIELRLDTLINGDKVQQFARRQRISLPVLLTARHPDEGGMNQLSIRQRAQVLSEFLSLGKLLDLELRSLDELKDIWESAAEKGMVRIVSWHDFTAVSHTHLTLPTTVRV